MKIIFTLAILLLAYFNHSQVSIKKAIYHYFSTFQLEDLKSLTVGTKILFQQNCTTKLPASIPTGIVFFENVYHEKEHFSVSIEFKDTVVVAFIFYLKRKNLSILNYLGYSKIVANASGFRRYWTAVLNEFNPKTILAGNKRKFIVIQSL